MVRIIFSADQLFAPAFANRKKLVRTLEAKELRHILP